MAMQQRDNENRPLPTTESLERFLADRRARAMDITEDEIQRMVEDGFAKLDKERFLREARELDEQRIRRFAEHVSNHAKRDSSQRD